jgi:hypothetical protein
MLRREFLIATPALLAAPLLAREDAAKTASRTAVLERVAVTGASVSRGFSSGVPLAALLDYAIRVEHEPVEDHSDPAMGIGMPGSGEAQIDRVLEEGRSLVVALDFLFWYVHFVPAGKDPAALRLERLDRGLAQLDRVEGPLVLGDIPAMHDVPETRLPPAARPDPDTLERAADRIRDFAAKRARVQLLPLASWVDELRAGKWTLEGSEDGKTARTPLTPELAVHDDRMHPTTLGALALGERVIAAIRERHGLLDREFSFDLWKAKRKLAAR